MGSKNTAWYESMHEIIEKHRQKRMKQDVLNARFTDGSIVTMKIPDPHGEAKQISFVTFVDRDFYQMVKEALKFWMTTPDGKIAMLNSDNGSIGLKEIWDHMPDRICSMHGFRKLKETSNMGFMEMPEADMKTEAYSLDMISDVVKAIPSMPDVMTDVLMRKLGWNGTLDEERLEHAGMGYYRSELASVMQKLFSDRKSHSPDAPRYIIEYWLHAYAK